MQNPVIATAAAAAVMPRAIMGGMICADGTDPKAVLASLTKAFEDFKAENDAKLKAKADIVIDEKVDRMNAEVTRLQAAIDAQAEAIALAKLGGAGAGIGDIQPDPEYTKAFGAHMRKGEVNATLQKTPDTDGGFLAPIEWDRTILGKLKILSPMRQHASAISISANGFSKLFQDRNVGSGWVGEAAARPATGTPGFASLAFTTGELYANPAATQQLLDDSAIDLEQWLAGEVELEFSRQEGIAFVTGNGTDKPFGILTYITGGANAARHPWGAITTVNSGAAAALTADGIISLIYDLPQAFSANAKLFANRQTHAAMRKLKDGQNNYLWQPSFQLGQPATLAGVPLVDEPNMPNIAAGAKAALYGDMAATYLIVDRIGVRVLRDPFTNKPFVQFYTTKRVGGGVVNPEPMRALNIAA